MKGLIIFIIGFLVLNIVLMILFSLIAFLSSNNREKPKKRFRKNGLKGFLFK